MSRPTLTALLVLTVALAGCIAGPGTPGTNDPADGDAGGSPPGVTDGRLANASALVQAHETALADEGFAATVTRSVDGNETGRYDVLAAAGLTTYVLSGTRSAGSDGSVAVRLWANESRRIVRYRAGNETRYNAARRETASLGLLESVGGFLRAGAFTVANETAAENRTVLTADDFSPSATDNGRFGDAESFSGRAVVDETGLVHELTATVGGETGTETYTFDLRRTGVSSVDRPAWLSEIPAGATIVPDLSVSVREETILVVRNEVGDAVPANATISLTTNGTTYHATFTAPIEPGEVRYATIAPGGGSLRLTAQQPTAGDTVALRSPVSVTIETAGGVTLHSVSMGWGSESASESGGGGESSEAASTGSESSTAGGGSG